MWTGFHTKHVSYGDFASSGAERFSHTNLVRETSIFRGKF